MTTEEPVQYEERDALAFITLNRPEKLNTLNGELLEAFAARWAAPARQGTTSTILWVYRLAWSIQAVSAVRRCYRHRVTGDASLLTLKTYEGMRVVLPGEFAVLLDDGVSP
jgi:hypothetical protein